MRSLAKRKTVQITKHAKSDGRGQDGNDDVNESDNGRTERLIMLGRNVLSVF